MQVEIFRDRPDEEEKNKKEYEVSVALCSLNTINRPHPIFHREKGIVAFLGVFRDIALQKEFFSYQFDFESHLFGCYCFPLSFW